MVWRLGIDLGTNSLGWAALEIERVGNVWRPVGIISTGVRIFSDGRNPKDKQSNASKRREPRGSRKNLDRYKRRRAKLMRELVMFGLMPEEPEERKKLEGGKGTLVSETDPWILRFRALNSELKPYQIGRALFHLHQRRGFKSNRKTDRGDANEKGKVHDATVRTLEKLKENKARTIGELFGKERSRVVVHNFRSPKGKRLPQPLARVRKSGSGSKWQYDYYPTRELVLSEFDQIWESQKRYHPELLSDEAFAVLRDTMEWQHPLKPQPVGKCTLLPEEPRGKKALVSSQAARIYQEVNSLRIAPTGEANRALTLEERDKVVGRLLRPSNKKASLSFNAIRKLLGLSSFDKFNLESEKRKELVGDLTTASLMQKDNWGEAWFLLERSRQDEIIERLIDDENEQELMSWLVREFDLDHERAIRIADCSLPDGHGALSKLALEKILPELESDVTVYSQAVEKALGKSHSQFTTGEVFDHGLPYYGSILDRSVAFGTGDPEDSDEKRYGRVANPTVHAALNQVQKIVNDLLKRFGPPEQIVVELARDLPLSAKGKGELERKIAENKKANDKRRELLASEYHQPDTYQNRMRLRLYEDLEALGKCCVYTGQQIGRHNLFSAEVEIEHILPFSRTFDDSYSNKTLSMRSANRDKGNKSPFEAFNAKAGYNWEDIARRADALPASKSWRFAPDAMERFENEENGFLARQLNDTRYIARLAKAYLEALYGGQGYSCATNRVSVIPGRLTADLRHVWGLNSVLRGHNEPESEMQIKNRNDHRHHAIDALVAACTDASMLQHAARQAKQNEDVYNFRLLAGLAEPWVGFRDDVERSIREITVSHKPAHGIQAAIFLDSAMSVIEEKDEDKGKNHVPLMRKYVPIETITVKNLDPGNKKSWTVVDSNIRLHLAELVKNKSEKEVTEAIVKWGQQQSPSVKRLRVYKRETGFAVTRNRDASEAYKYYKSAGNYCYDIWVGENGKWTGEVVSTYDAYQLSRKDQEWWRKPIGLDGQKLLFRLRRGDYLQLRHNDQILITQIAQMTEGVLSLAQHFEANVDARVRDKGDDLKFIFKSPGSLQESEARKVTVSPSGLVKIYH